VFICGQKSFCLSSLSLPHRPVQQFEEQLRAEPELRDGGDMGMNLIDNIRDSLKIYNWFIMKILLKY